MKSVFSSVCSFALCLAFVAGCGAGHSDAENVSSTGKLRSALTLPDGLTHDVTQVHFKAVNAPGNCNDAPVAETTASISSEALVPSLDPAGNGGVHAFADGLLTLAPGDYLICATPLDANGRPSTECALATNTTTVVAEQTAEIELTSQCQGNPNGLSDNVVVFNDPPKIDTFTITPSKFIDQCSSAQISVTASDANNESLSYSWEVLSGPGSSTLVGSGATATFTPAAAGDYQLKVTVVDQQGGSVFQTFPMHVSEAAANCATATCPDGSVEAEGYCWVTAQYLSDGTQESGSQACARVGNLTGADNDVAGLNWSEAILEEVAGKLGCTVTHPSDACCSPSMFRDTSTGECFATGFTTAQNPSYVNPAFDYNTNQLGVEACQKPSAH